MAKTTGHLLIIVLWWCSLQKSEAGRPLPKWGTVAVHAEGALLHPDSIDEPTNAQIQNCPRNGNSSLINLGSGQKSTKPSQGPITSGEMTTSGRICAPVLVREIQKLKGPKLVKEKEAQSSGSSKKAGKKEEEYGTVKTKIEISSATLAWQSGGRRLSLATAGKLDSHEDDDDFTALYVFDTVSHKPSEWNMTFESSWCVDKMHWFSDWLHTWCHQDKMNLTRRIPSYYRDDNNELPESHMDAFTFHEVDQGWWDFTDATESDPVFFTGINASSVPPSKSRRDDEAFDQFDAGFQSVKPWGRIPSQYWDLSSWHGWGDLFFAYVTKDGNIQILEAVDLQEIGMESSSAKDFQQHEKKYEYRETIKIDRNNLADFGFREEEYDFQTEGWVMRYAESLRKEYPIYQFTAVSFSSDLHHLLIGDVNGHLFLMKMDLEYQYESPERVIIQKIKFAEVAKSAHSSPIQKIGWAKDKAASLERGSWPKGSFGKAESWNQELLIWCWSESTLLSDEPQRFVKSPPGFMGITTFEFSSDGLYMAVLFKNGRHVHIWSMGGVYATEWRELQTLGHDGLVSAIAWSPCGTKLASVSASEGVVKVWYVGGMGQERWGDNTWEESLAGMQSFEPSVMHASSYLITYKICKKNGAIVPCTLKDTPKWHSTLSRWSRPQSKADEMVRLEEGQPADTYAFSMGHNDFYHMYRLWERHNSTVQRRDLAVISLPDNLWSVAYSPDMFFLAGVRKDGFIGIWDANFTAIAEYRSYDKGVRDLPIGEVSEVVVKIRDACPASKSALSQKVKGSFKAQSKAKKTKAKLSEKAQLSDEEMDCEYMRLPPLRRPIIQWQRYDNVLRVTGTIQRFFVLAVPNNVAKTAKLSVWMQNEEGVWEGLDCQQMSTGKDGQLKPEETSTMITITLSPDHQHFAAINGTHAFIFEMDMRSSKYCRAVRSWSAYHNDATYETVSWSNDGDKLIVADSKGYLEVWSTNDPDVLKWERKTNLRIQKSGARHDATSKGVIYALAWDAFSRKLAVLSGGFLQTQQMLQIWFLPGSIVQDWYLLKEKIIDHKKKCTFEAHFKNRYYAFGTVDYSQKGDGVIVALPFCRKIFVVDMIASWGRALLSFGAMYGEYYNHLDTMNKISMSEDGLFQKTLDGTSPWVPKVARSFKGRVEIDVYSKQERQHCTGCEPALSMMNCILPFIPPFESLMMNLDDVDTGSTVFDLPYKLKVLSIQGGKQSWDVTTVLPKLFAGSPEIEVIQLPGDSNFLLTGTL
eukprot:gnl/MRDRNA2_/MRDRNA2_127443_c0_seq1.p1 gnl/MRDRNA2_/MRDRNA2_127443_c0~~gnl/MRDRNA2_/MRDRNA2_127443_c0_seq1.p1  ORF type:complete len:1259 (+),score=198.09 gnl/MRDRNA2_/MRDRNA2_127443_c0_seq1:89-3865(+)